MREIFYANTFEKDLKTVKKYKNFKADKLKHYVELLAKGESLPQSAKNHPLGKVTPKRYQGMYDFHVAPDIVVIYKLDEKSIALIRIGQHNHLGLTENIF